MHIQTCVITCVYYHLQAIQYAHIHLFLKDNQHQRGYGRFGKELTQTKHIGLRHTLHVGTVVSTLGKPLCFLCV